MLEKLLVSNISILLIVIFVWLFLITVFLFRMIYHYNKLIKGADGEDLKKILDSILASSKKSEKEIESLSKRIKKIEEGIVSHIQRVGVTRFNPFADQGGDQSFSVSLLDKKGDGVVLSSLHSRTSTRIYAKPVRDNKGTSEYPLSKEEQKAVEKAKK